MKERYIFLLTLLVALVIFLGVYVTTRDLPVTQQQSLPWESLQNQKGQTVVFGLTMGETTLEEAMRVFGNEVEVSLFENTDKTFDVEVYVPSTRIGGFSARVILKLVIDQNHLKRLQQNIDQTEQLPTGNKQHKLKESSKLSLLQAKLESLSFIPHSDLTNEILLQRFGKASSVDKIQGIEYWHYPHKGLRVVIDSEGNDILEFFNIEKSL